MTTLHALDSLPIDSLVVPEKQSEKQYVQTSYFLPKILRLYSFLEADKKKQWANHLLFIVLAESHSDSESLIVEQVFVHRL